MRRVLNAIGLVLLGLVVFVPGWVLWHGRDLAEADDEGLRWQRPPIAPEENAYPPFRAAVERLTVTEEQWRTIGEAIQGDEASIASAAPVLEQNRAAMEAVEAALRRPRMQLPERATEDIGSDIMDWHRAARLFCLRAWMRADPRDAVADFLEALELGRRVEHAEGALLAEGMVGIAARGLALRSLSAWVAGHPLAPARGRELASSLGRFRHDPGAWRRIWAVEHQWTQRMIEGVELGQGEDWEFGGIAWSRFLPWDYLFHPNRTTELFADLHRQLARATEQRCEAFLQESWDPVRAEIEQKDGRLLFQPNFAGKVIAAIATPNFRVFPLRVCVADSQLAATQAAIGLRAWVEEHGSLPATLESLVPEYLDELPRDAFDGEPLRYDRERRWLYSIGEDLRDAGGDPDYTGAKDLSEPTFVLGFGPERSGSG